MKAFVIQGAFGMESLTRTDLPDPTPGHGQIVVRLRAASLNYRDIMVIKGHYNPRFKLPLVPGSDGAGEVVEVGAGVTRVKKGDRVAPIFMQAWLDGELTQQKARSSLGGPLHGTLAEYALVHEDGVVAVPQHLSDEEAAALPCAAVTAWNALVTLGALKAGDTVLVQGTGGVSLFALQIARLSGARVIVTSRSDEKLDRAKALGAWETINYATTPAWDERALALTDGVGVDHVVEVGGAGTLARSLKAVRYAGKVYVIGVLAGAAQEISVVPILMREIRVQGVHVGSRAMFEAMNRAFSRHGVRPVVDRVFPFEEAPAALAHLASGAHFGKVVVSI